jgi:hypothetical protein
MKLPHMVKEGIVPGYNKPDEQILATGMTILVVSFGIKKFYDWFWTRNETSEPEVDVELEDIP